MANAPPQSPGDEQSSNNPQTPVPSTSTPVAMNDSNNKHGAEDKDSSAMPKLHSFFNFSDKSREERVLNTLLAIRDSYCASKGTHDHSQCNWVTVTVDFKDGRTEEKTYQLPQYVPTASKEVLEGEKGKGRDGDTDAKNGAGGMFSSPRLPFKRGPSIGGGEGASDGDDEAE